jgi:hypothetical protein
MQESVNPETRRSRLSPAKRALLDSVLSGAAARPAGTGEIPPRPIHDRIPLSFAQQRLWFLHRVDPGSASYNIPVAVPIFGQAGCRLRWNVPSTRSFGAMKSSGRHSEW